MHRIGTKERAETHHENAIGRVVIDGPLEVLVAPGELIASMTKPKSVETCTNTNRVSTPKTSRIPNGI